MEIRADTKKLGAAARLAAKATPAWEKYVMLSAAEGRVSLVVRLADVHDIMTIPVGAVTGKDVHATVSRDILNDFVGIAEPTATISIDASKVDVGGTVWPTFELPLAELYEPDNMTSLHTSVLREGLHLTTTGFPKDATVFFEGSDLVVTDKVRLAAFRLADGDDHLPGQYRISHNAARKALLLATPTQQLKMRVGETETVFEGPKGTLRTRRDRRSTPNWQPIMASAEANPHKMTIRDAQAAYRLSRSRREVIQIRTSATAVSVDGQKVRGEGDGPGLFFDPAQFAAACRFLTEATIRYGDGPGPAAYITDPSQPAYRQLLMPMVVCT